MNIGQANFSDDIKNILPAMIKVQKKMPALAKDAANPHSSSDYVTLDNILEKLTPLLNDEGILLLQPADSNKEEEHYEIGVETIFLHKSGEYMYVPATYFQFEKGGRMNLTQSAGSLITYSRRYMLTTILGIRTGEDVDGNMEVDHAKNEFYENEQELHNRVKKLAEESNQDLKAVHKLMLKRTSEDFEEQQHRITEENISSYNKHLRLAEVKFQKNKTAKSEQQDEQTSLMEGNTTKTVNWGEQ